MAFECSSLTSITIPDSVTSIEYRAFVYNFSLTSIHLPKSITTIGAWAFSDCTSLAQITCLAPTPPTCE
ncbi:MAG: leucine-rich repeat protein [Paludibacteraceae bacterium]